MRNNRFSIVSLLVLLVLCIPSFYQLLKVLNSDLLYQQQLEDQLILPLSEWEARLFHCTGKSVSTCQPLADGKIQFPHNDKKSNLSKHLSCDYENNDQCANLVELAYLFSDEEIDRLRQLRGPFCHFSVFFPNLGFNYIKPMKFKDSSGQRHWDTSCIVKNQIQFQVSKTTDWDDRVVQKNLNKEIRVFYPYEDLLRTPRITLRISPKVISQFGPKIFPPLITSETNFSTIAPLSLIEINKKGFFDFGVLLLALIAVLACFGENSSRSMEAVAIYLIVWSIYLFAGEDIMSDNLTYYGVAATIPALACLMMTAFFSIPNICLSFLNIKVPSKVVGGAIGISVLAPWFLDEFSRSDLVIHYDGIFLLFGGILGFVTSVTVKLMKRETEWLAVLPCFIFSGLLTFDGLASGNYLVVFSSLEQNLVSLASTLGIVVFAFVKDAAELSKSRKISEQRKENDVRAAKVMARLGPDASFNKVIKTILTEASKVAGFRRQTVKYHVTTANNYKPRTEDEFEKTVFNTYSPFVDSFTEEQSRIHGIEAGIVIDFEFPQAGGVVVSCRYQNFDILKVFIEGVEHDDPSLEKLKTNTHFIEIYRSLAKIKVSDLINNSINAVAGNRKAYLFGNSIKHFAELRVGDTSEFEGKKEVLFLAADLQSYSKYEGTYGKELMIKVVASYQSALTEMVHGRNDLESRLNLVYRYEGDGNLSVIERANGLFPHLADVVDHIIEINRKEILPKNIELPVKARFGFGYGSFDISLDGTPENLDPNITSQALINSKRLESAAKQLNLLHLFSENAVEAIGEKEKFQYLGDFEIYESKDVVALYGSSELENKYRRLFNEPEIDLAKLAPFLQKYKEQGIESNEIESELDKIQGSIGGIAEFYRSRIHSLENQAKRGWFWFDSK